MKSQDSLVVKNQSSTGSATSGKGLTYCVSAFLSGCRYQQDLPPWAEESLDEMIRGMYSEQSLAL